MKTIFISIIAISLSFPGWTQKSAMLKLNMQPNKTYNLKSTSQQNMSQSMGGMQQNTVTNSTTILSIRLMEKDTDFMVVEIRFDSIKINTSNPAMNFSINSANPGDLYSTNIGDVLSVFMHRYCSNPLYAKMTYEGNVIDFINIKLFTDMMLKDVDSIKTQMAPMIKARAGMIADPKAIQSTVESILAYLPGKKVEAGDSWDISQDLNSGGMMYQVKSHYILNEIKDDKADISYESTMDPANSGPVQMYGSTITNNGGGYIHISTLSLNTYISFHMIFS